MQIYISFCETVMFGLMEVSKCLSKLVWVAVSEQ